MLTYRCRCGQTEAYGSMPPTPCSGCKFCGTTLETHPTLWRDPPPHDYIPTPVMTDEGPKTLTRCRWCGRVKD